MKHLIQLLDRVLPSLDTTLTLACIVWGVCAALLLLGGALWFM